MADSRDAPGGGGDRARHGHCAPTALPRKDILLRIRGIVSSLAGSEAEGLSEDADLFEEGMLESSDMPRLIGRVERELGLRLPILDLERSRVKSLGGLADSALSAMAGKPPAPRLGGRP